MMTVTAADLQVVVNLVRILTALGILGFASYKDWKIREVEDESWMAMEIVGFGLLLVTLVLWGSELIHYLFLFPIFTACAYAFWGSPEIKELAKGSKPDILWGVVYAVSIIIVIVYVYLNVIKTFPSFPKETQMLLPMFLVILLYYLLYYLNIGGIHLLHGGADAKGLIALSVLVPLYPVFWSLPLKDAVTGTLIDSYFPFSLSILMNAAALAVLVYLLFPFINIAHRKFGIQMFFGYTMDINKVGDSHVWLMQRCDKNFKQRIVLMPASLPGHKGDLRRLKKLGEERVWVSPKVPFIIPIFLGVIAQVVVGNLMLAFLMFIQGALLT